MSQVNVNIPSDCLSSLSCLELSFDVPIENVVQQQGTPASLNIPRSVFDELQIGSTITMNDTIFTYTTVSDICKNEIGFSVNPILNILSFVLSVGNNYRLNECFDFAIGVDDLLISALDCVKTIDISFGNLINPTGSFIANPTALLLNEYQICCSLVFEGSIPCDNIEFNIPPKTNADCEQCTLESVEASKDIGCLVEELLQTPLPDLSCDTFPISSLNPTQKVSLSLRCGESINGNVFTQTISDGFDVYNGYGDFSESCGQSDAQLITVHDSESFVCQKQSNRVYLDLPQDSLHNVVAIITLYDSSGSILAIPVVVLFSDTGSGILEVQTGLPNIATYLQSVGFTDFEDVASYDFLITNFSMDNGIVSYDGITYNVDCCDCFVEFVFLSSKRTYETVTLECAKDESLTIINDIVTTCKPCEQPVKQVRKSEATRTLTYKTGCDRLSKNMICELFNATEVYINIEGELFRVSPNNSTAILLTNDFSQSIPFVVDVEVKENIGQC